MHPKQLLLIELNEVNFEYVEFYCDRGRLPHFAELIQRHGVSRTTSETEYHNLEPWIQWVTAHTGLKFSEHGVFRLGDIVTHDIPQIWELLEAEGLKVGAISPMNAKHRLQHPAFFVPDPWTSTKVTARPALTKMYKALAQAVNDNAEARITAKSAWALLCGALIYADPLNYQRYLRLASSAGGHPWRRAMFLDLLLADVFRAEVKRSQPHFATLFLNAAAHIQHHYMFSAAPYDGPHRNPSWYIKEHLDPVGEVYELYDHIVAKVMRDFSSARVMLATALHQDPFPELLYYWRLKNHAEFLRMLGLDFVRVEPRMSRDFLVVCATERQAIQVADCLNHIVADDGRRLFDVDNRGRDLFVVLTYPDPISETAGFVAAGKRFNDLRSHVTFVAVKNGEHNGVGYFLDTGQRAGMDDLREFPLHEIPDRISTALDVRRELSHSGRVQLTRRQATA